VEGERDEKAAVDGGTYSIADASSVTRELDPRVHRRCWKIARRKLDCRVKPGNDAAADSWQA
jgi:hypothetical protein